MRKDLPKPKNWQDFETLCLKLWGEIWGVSTKIKKHGRPGQAQMGVDIYAIPTGEKGYWGIQCKAKDGAAGAKLSKKEIDHELAQALAFEPKLSGIIIATTANKDAEIEKYVRYKDVESRQGGGPEILLYCWEDIDYLIEGHRNTFDWYVNQHQFQTSSGFDVTFEDGTKELVIEPVFEKVTRKFRYKPPQANPTLRQDSEQETDESAAMNKGIYRDTETEEAMAGPFTKVLAGLPATRYLMEAVETLSRRKMPNLAKVNFAIVLTNTGDKVIEDWKVSLDFEGAFRSLTDTESLYVVSLSKGPTSYRDNCIWYEPVDNRPLVGKDSRNFEADLIPEPQQGRIGIKWQMLSRDFRTEGELVLIVEPFFEQKREFYIDENHPEGRKDEVVSITEKGNPDSRNYAKIEL